ncbi:glycosyltransferase family 4 protein [Thermosynechococcus sp. PP22]|uniref:glycosyltransferase family 4 protein n=1 Tax=Thermosynechococcus sp. PP22 TaxID=3074082 RepID=UPI00287322A2|nr:glycosyltransferase family 4 protein [Thermosynechococcus sp. PP22]WNC23017.1 glycosyltransferase family 4 protein [Thermosynechococcus sp. PP22]
MNVLFLTKYDRDGASSRYRFFQYINYLKERGFNCEILPLLNQQYLHHLYTGDYRKYIHALKGIFNRLIKLLRLNHYNLVILEKEIFPYMPFFIENYFIPNVPIVVDYDDAIFHQYDQHKNKIIKSLLSSKIASIMNSATLVTAGNNYIAEYARNTGARWVEVLPTVVDLSKYTFVQNKINTELSRLKIVWIGTPKTQKYLLHIASVLTRLSQIYKIQLIAIGTHNLHLPKTEVISVPWSEETEAQDIAQCDIGIMPLPDEPWERGKCGLKLIQYMACGLPVVASPVGANLDIVQHGVHGFLASTNEEWATALETLIQNADLRTRMGLAGRRRVEQHYALQVTAPKLAHLLESVVAKAQGVL